MSVLLTHTFGKIKEKQLQKDLEGQFSPKKMHKESNYISFST